MITRILIADDDPISSRTLEKNIKQWGYETITTENGEEAWQVIQKNEIRLAILDWMMPEIDGVELCRKIRRKFKSKRRKYIYIILLTGRGHQDDLIKGLSAGADDYMTKPFNPLELKVRIKNGIRIIELEDSRIRSASFDGLTNLWNRNKIFEFFEDELKRSSKGNHPISTIMLDIDYFKRINDTCGHITGDKVLAEVAYTIRNSIREDDRIGRYGGDEMLVVLPKCGLKEAEKVAERIHLNVFKAKLQTQKTSSSITISIGVSSSENMPHASMNELIQASDKALYMAKAQGRNRIVVADSPLHLSQSN